MGRIALVGLTLVSLLLAPSARGAEFPANCLSTQPADSAQVGEQVIIISCGVGPGTEYAFLVWYMGQWSVVRGWGVRGAYWTPPEAGNYYIGALVRNQGATSADDYQIIPFQVTSSTESACGNGVDDDMDGLVDCADPDCSASPDCSQGCSDFVALSAGKSHTCAITATGGVQCWGNNGYGQLGDGTTTASLTPVDVVGLTQGAQAISAGERHTCAMLNTGGIQCWGDNGYGQLGDGTSEDRLTPTDVSGLGGEAVAISLGREHTCAVLTTGGAKCWGFNGFGQVGDRTSQWRSTPVNVSGLTSGVSAIDAGMRQTCALLTTGDVQCWGHNGYGQLGDGTYWDRTSPVNVLDLSSLAVAVSTGEAHSCALLDNGGVQCWGNNGYGQLGDGTTTDRNRAASVSGISSGEDLSLGSYHTCVILTSGGTQCWGYNANGQLGDGTTTNRLSPVDVSGLSSHVNAIDGGNQYTCALITTGGLQCWGANDHGQLGNETLNGTTTPGDVLCP